MPHQLAQSITLLHLLPGWIKQHSEDACTVKSQQNAHPNCRDIKWKIQDGRSFGSGVKKYKKKWPHCQPKLHRCQPKKPVRLCLLFKIETSATFVEGAPRTFGSVEASAILRVGNVLGEGILSELHGNIACNTRSVFQQSPPGDGVQQAVFRLYKKAKHQPSLKRTG